MSEISKEERFRARPTCRYGTKCRTVDEEHLKKYKHPPGHNPHLQKPSAKRKRKPEPKRKALVEDDETSQSKIQKTDTEEEKEVERELEAVASEFDVRSESPTSEKVTVASLLVDQKIDAEREVLSEKEARLAISHLFLTEMLEDFYEFYKLCKSLSSSDPLNAFKDADLRAVGPFDVFGKNFLKERVESREAFLRHWRFFYDPPEFQTVLTVAGSRCLHFGYWRDEISAKPVFVAKNEAAVDCLIKPVAENLFGAVDAYLQEKLGTVDVFRKSSIQRLHQKLKKHAQEANITLEKNTNDMQARRKKVVAKTFHKAGIVVPYNKKTQLGYRELAMTDKELQVLLQKIDKSASEDLRKPLIAQLQEVVRLATIAADECDFGTCLELGHDLFSSGIVHVQQIASQMFNTAYTLLERNDFATIMKTHLKNRRKGSTMSVL